MTETQDFTQGPILRKLLKFALPILLALLLQALYTAADLLIVGQFSNTSQVAAVATGGQVMQTLTSLISSMSIGITIIIAQVLGQGKRDQVPHIIMNGLALFAGLALFLTILVASLAPQLAQIMHAPQVALTATVAYLRISGYGAVFIVGYNLVGSIFRGLGDAITPLITVGIAAIINVGLDLVLVAALNMGASGAAIATVMAQALSLVVFYLLARQRNGQLFSLQQFKHLDGKLLKKILRLGSPIAVQDFLINLSFVVILAIGNTMGVTASAGIGVGEKATAFIMLLPSSFMQAMAAFVAQNVGAKQHARARQSLGYGIGASLAFAVVMAYLSFFHGDLLARIFTQDQAVMAATALYMKSYAFDVLMTAIFFCFVGYFNGYGETKFVMIQGLIGALVIRIPLAFFFTSLPGANLFYLGMATPTSSLIQIGLCGGYYLMLRRRISVAEHNVN